MRSSMTQRRKPTLISMGIQLDGFLVCNYCMSMFVFRDQNLHDCDILQSILSDSHYEVADEDRATLQAVVATLSQDSDSQTTTVNDDIGVF